MIWTDEIRNDTIELRRKYEGKYYLVLFEGMNPDEVFESLYIEQKRYKFNFGQNIKIKAFDCFLKNFSYFDLDIPPWGVCRLGFTIPIKIPMFLYGYLE